MHAVFAITTTLLSAVIAGLMLLAWRYYKEARQEWSACFTDCCRAEQERDQALAERDQLRKENYQALTRAAEHRRTDPDVAMLEDLAAIGDDIDRELEHYHEYIGYQLRKFKEIMASGRPSPHSYKSLDTAGRPPRPGQQVHAWRL